MVLPLMNRNQKINYHTCYTTYDISNYVHTVLAAPGYKMPLDIFNFPSYKYRTK